ncbi:juvenile hormone acid O-methyltransferase-like [Argiope bruennichi]|uniref:juvenile hormone acid O-methyltransferase-like n=1 Tax=Argiope bruennichi TaxID=94029 RepID=UPI002494C515|nr:juvenile hormone acid O-methyltransferase-like [Argiope bruennichi]XP_055945934.1 juvenile hormone acid O-methyltransferase-like [Argiope bruennichi]
MSGGGVDPVLYSKYHHLQERDVNDFLLASASILNWGNLTNKVVMDVGCGPGNTSCSWFLMLFPAVKGLIGIDVQEEMIGLAKILNPHPKIEFMVADITDETSVECWEGTLNKVISTWCFQFIKDQQIAFRNIYNLLRPGGEAAILFEINSSYHVCYEEIMKSPKWNTIFESVAAEYPEICTQNVNAAHYKQLLTEMGFKVVMCTKKQKSFTFSSDDDCIGYALSMFAWHKKVPDERMEEFRSDLLQEFSKYGGRESNGRITIHYSLMNILVKKPS